MKLTQLAAAALITLSPLAAHAGYLQLDGGATSAIPPINFYAASVGASSYNVGGNLKSNIDGWLELQFDFLGAEAGWKNTFSTSAGSIDNLLPSPSFTSAGNYAIGDLLGFTFTTSGSGVLPNSVANGGNNNGDHWVSFATVLDATFNSTLYDAILFFDDTGGFKDDDNHDDLVIGIKVTSVPESSTLALLMMGLIGLFAARRTKA
ncbi:MAG TPA: PEP-CTERM sorting domain-containing protein [Cellvibrio sp.]|nr:PEP-CTERM sorting domain-containing protein [Cellvibrio sp.]